MREKLFIIPVFIPHAGCHHECIYCNQKAITGQSLPLPSREEIRETIEKYLGFPAKRHKERCFVAFYGGTFTALPMEKQIELLDVAHEFVKKGLIRGVRFSTRPDYISDDELAFLESYRISAIELGAQSMDNRVLRACARGHTAESTRVATELIKHRGISLGIQIMVGLPRDTRESFLKTVDEVIKLEPDFVRIYPTLVLRDSPLAGLYEKGNYTALDMNEAVDLTLRAYVKLRKANIRVARMGLQAEPWFDEKGTIVAGPYHPSFGELVMAAYYDKLISAVLDTCQISKDTLDVVVPAGSVSQVRGHRGSNINRWKKRFNISEIYVRESRDLCGEIILKSGVQEWKISCQD